MVTVNAAKDSSLVFIAVHLYHTREILNRMIESDVREKVGNMRQLSENGVKRSGWRARTIFGLTCFLAVQIMPCWGQAVSQMRTRYFTSLTNPEIEQYLKRNDVIFIPVGAIETFGSMPTGMEYTMGEAYALKLAEEADALILPWVTYFYPGVTVTGVGSVYVPQNIGFEYLKAIAHSLLRQGFRRQVYLSAHGPSNQYVSGMVRDFFEETKCPILYIDLATVQRNARTGGAGAQAESAFRSIGYGAYYIVGRMEEIPLELDIAPPAEPPLPRPPDSIRKLQALAPGSGAVGTYDPDAEHNGGRPLESFKMTAEQREKLGKEGAARIEAVIKSIDIKSVVQAMRDEDKYVRDVIVPRYKSILPKDTLQ
jgi:creatinine amidohydrolase